MRKPTGAKVFCALIGALVCTMWTMPVQGKTQASQKVVCIDPGHPSETNPGRAIQNGLTELKVNWQVAGKLATFLSKEGVRVVITKSSCDQFVSNRRRAEIANACKASIFLRLHCDTGQKSGFAVYYPDRQSEKFGHRGPAPEVIAESRLAAECVHHGMLDGLPGALNDAGLLGEASTAVGRRQGALTGSIFSRVPVVTVEMAVLSNKHDAAFIGSKRGQEAVARALAVGVRDWLQKRNMP